MSSAALFFKCGVFAFLSQVVATTDEAPGIVYADIDLSEIEVISLDPTGLKTSLHLTPSL